MATRNSSSGHDAFRITSAAQSRAQDIAARQRRYIISMAVRVMCFIGAVAVGPGWLRWVLVAGAVLLPYVAVVLANGTDTRDDAFDVAEPGARHQLPPASRPDDIEGPPRD